MLYSPRVMDTQVDTRGEDGTWQAAPRIGVSPRSLRPDTLVGRGPPAEGRQGSWGQPFVDPLNRLPSARDLTRRAWTTVSGLYLAGLPDRTRKRSGAAL